MKTFVEIVSIICPDGLVKIDRFDTSVDGTTIYVYYEYDSSVEAKSKSQRLALLEHIIELKFKQFVLVENSPEA